MSKYIFFTDAHAKGVNSTNRKGDYFADWLIKFEEMLQIAQKEGVEAIIDGGDMLDTAEPSYRIVDSILDLIEQYKIPFYCLYGNHAMRYRSTENSRYTGLAHMFKRSQYVHHLSNFSSFDIALEAFEYSHTIEEDINRDGIFVTDERKEGDSNRWKIAVVHAMIMDKPFFKDVSHCVCKDIKTDADLILLGHYHHPFKVVTDTTEFLNVGSFGRNSINEMNIKPSIVLLDSEDRSYKIIELKTAKPGEEIFDKEKYNEKKENKKTIEEFLEAMKNTDVQGMDLKDQIKTLGKKFESDQEVIDYLLLKKEEVENNE